MKRIAISLVCPLIGVLLMASCLGKEDEVTKSSDVALLSFGIKDLKTVHTIQKENGEDSTYTTVMSGASIAFTIDQTRHLVYNSDSIAYGTNVSRVLVNVKADGYVYYLKANGEVGSVEDSIDFTSPVTFRVKSYDEQFTRDYRVSINVHQVDPKETVWVQLEGTDFPSNLFVSQKALVRRDSVFVIGRNTSGALYVAATSVTDGVVWKISECSGVGNNADCTSVLLVGDTLLLTADDVLYRSVDAVTWTPVGNTSIPISCLLAVENGATPVAWGVSGDSLVSTGDMAAWAAKQQLKVLLSRGVASFSQPLRTNEDIMRTVFVAVPQIVDTCAQVWTKLSTDSCWVEIGTSGNNIYGCPNLENLAVISYADKMYAFGGKSVGAREVPLEPFEMCYESRDNGVTWKSNKVSFSLPKAFVGRSDTFSATTDGEYVWVMWANGEVWRGRWNGIG